jgi:hypothetical protein
VPDACFRALYVKENATNGHSFSTTILGRTGIESGGKWPFAAGNSARMDQLDRGVGQGDSDNMKPMELERESRFQGTSQKPRRWTGCSGDKRSLLRRTRVSLEVRHCDLLQHTLRRESSHESTFSSPHWKQTRRPFHVCVPCRRESKPRTLRVTSEALKQRPNQAICLQDRA